MIQNIQDLVQASLPTSSNMKYFKYPFLTRLFM